MWISTNGDSTPGRVIGPAPAPRSYIVETDRGEIHRNRNHLRVVPDSSQSHEHTSDNQNRIVTDDRSCFVWNAKPNNIGNAFQPLKPTSTTTSPTLKSSRLHSLKSTSLESRLHSHSQADFQLKLTSLFAHKPILTSRPLADVRMRINIG